MKAVAAVVLMITATTVGCAQVGAITGLTPDGAQLSKPDELGLVAKFQNIPVTLSPETLASANPAVMKIERNDILSAWVMRSDYICSQYQARISSFIKDSRLSTDVAATILSGLATIFTKIGMTHPLSGAATIVMGVGSNLQSDLFLQQTADVVATAIQTVRIAARRELQKNWAAPYADYTLAQALVDVQRYDRETCTIDRAMSDIRSSISVAAPAALGTNNPIVGALPATPQAGAAQPLTTTITAIPPQVVTTPQGTTVTTSPQVQVTTSATFPSSPPQPPPALPRGSQSNAGGRPGVRILDKCPAVEPALVTAFKGKVIELIVKLVDANDTAKLQRLANGLGQPGLVVASAVNPAMINAQNTGDKLIRFVRQKLCSNASMEDLKSKLGDFQL